MTTESSHSGLVRTLGKRVWVIPPGVRISHSPHILKLHLAVFYVRRVGSVETLPWEI